MIRYVTQWDGTTKVFENIKFVINLVRFDKLFKFVRHYDSITISDELGNFWAIDKGSEVTIWQDGTIEVKNDFWEYKI